MEKHENLELTGVQYNPSHNEAKLQFLDRDNGEVFYPVIRTVVWEESSRSFQPDAEQAKKAVKIAQDEFGVGFDQLPEAVGKTHDVYHYENYDSLFESKSFPRLDESLKGTTINAPITKIEDDGSKIMIYFDYEGTTYFSRIKYGAFVQSEKKWYPIAGKKPDAYKRFEQKTGVPFEEAQSIIGKTGMFEVKMTGGYTWSDLKTVI